MLPKRVIPVTVAAILLTTASALMVYSLLFPESLPLDVAEFDPECPVISHGVSLVAYFTAGILCFIVALYVKQVTECHSTLP